jgi:ABC-2 type transport system permease protein
MFTTLRYTFTWMRGQILGWGLSVAALGLMIVPFYSVFMDRQEDFVKMIEGYPPEFLAFFGGDAITIMTPEGFLGMYGFSMLPVILGIFAVITGSGMFAGDEEAGRLDLILAYPVGRTRLFWGRTLAFVAAMSAILVIGWLGFSILLDGSKMEISWGEMALPFLPVLAQGLVYGLFALLMSMLLPSRSLAAMAAGILMVASYFLTSMSSLNEGLAKVAQFLPYHYFQSGAAIRGLNLEWLLGLLTVSGLMAALAWLVFLRRDIRRGGEGSWRSIINLGKRRAAVPLPNIG